MINDHYIDDGSILLPRKNYLFILLIAHAAGQYVTEHCGSHAEQTDWLE